MFQHDDVSPKLDLCQGIGQYAPASAQPRNSSPNCLLVPGAGVRPTPGDQAHMTKVSVQPHGRVNGSGFAVEEADAAHVHGPIVGGGHDRTLIES
jgi:hypothetical protein